ncbi:MAG: 4-hydroxy-tetrahydrodipicolinate synthase [Candidatus Binatia bacterium]|nr:4-hydroxy-tetrahydrodipicolinate synthase [Candidatus Binatia bacterium]
MTNSNCPFTGSFVALVTPFRDGKVDHEALKALVDRQIAAGQSGLVPCGSTGESATLDHEEHGAVIETVVKHTAGRVPVIAGTGSNATAEAISLTKEAEAAGANGALLISPYYVKPTQEGIIDHYRAVAESTSLPLIVYNIPGRTASTIEVPTLARLAEVENLVAVKDSTGSLDSVMDTIAACGDKMAVLSGDDSLSLPLIAMGATGSISAMANVIPKEIADLTSAALAGRWDDARRIHYRILPLIRACFLESNPIPIKAAVAMLGGCENSVRLPLRPLTDGAREKLTAAMKDFGLPTNGAGV